MSAWPALRVEEWSATRDTLHLWTQIVGKVMVAKAPPVNHWWHVTFTLSARGFRTGPIPDGSRIFSAEFDFVNSVLRIEEQGGGERTVALAPQPMTQFYAETRRAFEELGIHVQIWPRPVEIEEVVDFDSDTRPREYDAVSAATFWQQLVQADRVLRIFRGRFAGKASPVHLFWGALDLAATRFSGRTAPRHPGGIPNCADWVMVEGYSHELASAGFWPGGGEEGAFYAYAYPEPDGYAQWPVRPAEASYVESAAQFRLPYEAVRRAHDPDATLLAFLEDTYQAARQLGSWDPALDYVPFGGR